MLRPGIDRKYAVVLLIAAMTVVGMGVVIRLRKQERPSPARPSEMELARLQRLTQERRLRDLSAYLSESADSAGAWLVSLDPGRRTGLVWGGRVIAPASSRGEEETIILEDGRRVTAKSVLVPPGVPFSVLRPSEPIRTEVRRSAPLPEPGDWVLAVARSTTGAILFAQGLYQGSVDGHCGEFSYEAVQSSVPLSPALAGGGLFTTRGRLLGFIADCGGNAIAVSTATLSEVLQRPVSENDRLERLFGFRVATGAEKDSSGALVTAVWKTSLAETAGLRPGDTITQIGDSRIQSAADVGALAREADEDHILQVRRGKRTIEIPLPGARHEGSAPGPSPQGITLGANRDGLAVVTAVTPDSTAAAAGVRSGDMILGVQGATFDDPASLAKVLEKLSGRPVLLRVERNRSRLEVLVSP